MALARGAQDDTSAMVQRRDNKPAVDVVIATLLPSFFLLSFLLEKVPLRQSDCCTTDNYMFTNRNCRYLLLLYNNGGDSQGEFHLVSQK